MSLSTSNLSTSPRLLKSLRDSLSNFSATHRLEAVRRLALERGVTGGLLKRIDENRELLELLQRESPQLLKSNPWMVGWLQANDDFFVELAQLLKVHSRDIGFPRAWPGPVATPGAAMATRAARPRAKPRPAADAFLAWVGESLRSGSLSYNKDGAPVHFTADGMALVSPKIFKLYLKNHEYEGDLLVSQDPIKMLQSDLRRGGYNVRGDGVDLFVYELRTTRAQLHCFVLPHPERYLCPLPPVNSVLRRLA
jgi:hypothetical protein